MELTVCFSDLAIITGHTFALITLVRLYDNSMLLKSLYFLKLLLFGRIIKFFNPNNNEPTLTEYYLEHLVPIKYPLFSVIHLFALVIPAIAAAGNAILTHIYFQFGYVVSDFDIFRP